LDEVSRIELGFPYEFLRGPQGQMVYGDLGPQIDLPSTAPYRWRSVLGWVPMTGRTLRPITPGLR
jgi:hypothetical protein